MFRTQEQYKYLYTNRAIQAAALQGQQVPILEIINEYIYSERKLANRTLAIQKLEIVRGKVTEILNRL